MSRSLVGILFVAGMALASSAQADSSQAWEYANSELTDGSWVLGAMVSNGGITITSVKTTAADGVLDLSAEVTDAATGAKYVATAIAYKAFSGAAVTRARLPHVKSISAAAFRGCTSLTEVTVGEQLTTLGCEAFNGCTALTTFSPLLPASLKTLGTSVYNGSVNSIAFNGCTSLTGDVKLVNAALTDVYGQLFQNTKITSCYAPYATNVWKFAFNGCSAITNITFGKEQVLMNSYRPIYGNPKGLEIYFPGKAPVADFSGDHAFGSQNYIKVFGDPAVDAASWRTLCGSRYFVPLTEADKSRSDYPGKGTLGLLSPTNNVYAWLVKYRSPYHPKGFVVRLVGPAVSGTDTPEPDPVILPEPEPVIPDYTVNLADYSNVINVQTAWGVVEGADVSEGVASANTTAINRGIAAAASGATVYFPSGNYRVNAAIAVTEKTRLTLLGDHATLLRSGTDNTLASDWSSQILSISYCTTPVTVKGFTLRYESDTSWSGVIAAKGTDYVDIEVTDGSVPNAAKGWGTWIQSRNEDGYPDGVVDYPGNMTRTVTAEGFLRVYCGSYHANRFTLGQKASVASNGYNYQYAVLCQSNTGGVTFEDFVIRNSFNGGIINAGYSRDLTLRRVSMIPVHSNALESTSRDGVHLTGLAGALVLEDCNFKHLGDDALNVNHIGASAASDFTRSGTRTSVTVTYSDYANMRTGDVFEFFSATNGVSLGCATTVDTATSDYKTYKLTFATSSLPSGLTTNVFFANKTLHPTVRARGCFVKGGYARGFLIQTDDVIVTNCTFQGMRLAGVLLAPNFRIGNAQWNETSPVRGATIADCTFNDCSRQSYGAVFVSSNHDYSNWTAPYSSFGRMHEDIAVKGCTFTNCNASAVSMYAVKGVTIADNVFGNLSSNAVSRSMTQCAIYLHNCSNVSRSNNVGAEPGREYGGYRVITE